MYTICYYINTSLFNTVIARKAISVIAFNVTSFKIRIHVCCKKNVYPVLKTI